MSFDNFPAMAVAGIQDSSIINNFFNPKKALGLLPSLQKKKKKKTYLILNFLRPERTYLTFTHRLLDPGLTAKEGRRLGIL